MGANFRVEGSVLLLFASGAVSVGALSSELAGSSVWFKSGDLSSTVIWLEVSDKEEQERERWELEESRTSEFNLVRVVPPFLQSDRNAHYAHTIISNFAHSTSLVACHTDS
jgi:hypothetical protein